MMAIDLIPTATPTEARFTDRSLITAANTAARTEAPESSRRISIRELRRNPELSGRSILRVTRTRPWRETGTKSGKCPVFNLPTFFPEASKCSIVPRFEPQPLTIFRPSVIRTVKYDTLLVPQFLEHPVSYKLTQPCLCTASIFT